MTTGADGALEPAAQQEDAVQLARRWLAERGVAVPDDGSGPTTHYVARPAPAPTGDRPAAAPSGETSAELTRESSPPSTDPARVHGAGTRNALGFGTSGSEDRPRRRRARDEAPTASDDPDADPESVARTIVLRKLAAQARTRAELEKALKVKDVPDEAARAVLDRMEAVGLVDDQGFARDWVESRQQRRYLSKGALRRELSAKGVDADEIESALSTVDREDELEAARQLAAKKVKTMAALERPVQYRRLVGALGRRGFSSAIVGRVVRETLDLNET